MKINVARLAGATALVLGSVGIGTARADLLEGWQIRTLIDAFADTVAPVLTKAKDNDMIMPTQIGVVCGDPEPRLIYSPSGISMGEPEAVSFRLGAKTVEVVFRASEHAGLGKRLTAPPDASAEIIAYLATTREPLSFKTKSDTGTFGHHGFAMALRMLRGECSGGGEGQGD